MHRFIEGVDRSQTTLLPDRLEDWIDEDNAVRVVAAFVDALDLNTLGFERAVAAATGRPGYHPVVLLKLYIYGYLNRVQSSRRLEREAGRNVEVMWLLGRLVPDHKTIADFRKDNGTAIAKVCSRFVELCRRIGLLSVASVAIDGSKFKAVNNRDRNFTKAKMARRMKQIDESVERYLHQLDSADRQEPTAAITSRVERLHDKIGRLREEMQRLQVLEKQMMASPDEQVSLTDPDARSMATSGRGSGVVGYNVQAAVETDHHLIVAHDVVQTGSDRAQLEPMAQKAKEALGVDELDVVADRGYFSAGQIKDCADSDITPTLPKPQTSSNRKKGMFVKTDFRYVPGEDTYICPAGETLTWATCDGRERLGGEPLLDGCLRQLPPQKPVHHGQGTAHQPLGVRTSCRGDAAAPRREPRRHAPAPRDGGTPVRHHQDADGRNPLFDEAIEQRQNRDGPERAGLQSHPGHEHHRHQAADGGNPGVTGRLPAQIGGMTHRKRFMAPQQSPQAAISKKTGKPKRKTPIGKSVRLNQQAHAVSTQPRPIADIAAQSKPHHSRSRAMTDAAVGRLKHSCIPRRVSAGHLVKRGLARRRSRQLGFPECPGHAVDERAYQIVKKCAFTGFDVSLDRHAGDRAKV